MRWRQVLLSVGKPAWACTLAVPGMVTRRRACAGARACAQAPSVMLALTGARGPLELFVGQGPCGHGWRRGQAQARDARAAAGPLGGPGLLLAEDRRPWYLASAGRLGHADPQRRAPTGSHSLSAPDTATRGRCQWPLSGNRAPAARQSEAHMAQPGSAPFPVVA